MSRTLSHSVVLQAPADDVWEACKHADKILCDLMPEYFAKTEFLHGHGEPGSIRVITMGPAIPHAGQVKERMDKFDESTKTLGYTVLEGDPRYSSFSAEMQFVPVHGSSTTEAVWTATYEPAGDMGPPEHVKAIATMVFKTLERAVNSEKKTLTVTETLQASPDAIWNNVKHAEAILTKALPQYFASSKMIQGHGEPGSIRVVTMGPEITWAIKVTERIDLVDEANKKMGYTVLKGDPRYKYLAATMQFSAGPSKGTTKAEWVVTFVAEGDMGPPEHIKTMVLSAWKALTDAVAHSSTT